MSSIKIKPLVLLLSLSTAGGILLHDTRLDKAASTRAELPAVMANYETANKFNNFGTDSHIHTEESSIAQAVHDLRTSSPGLQPRSNEEKKYLLQKYATRGHHPFDNYNLSIV